jgi:hypothetical protein
MEISEPELTMARGWDIFVRMALAMELECVSRVACQRSLIEITGKRDRARRRSG